jgi:predicted amidohydrolase
LTTSKRELIALQFDYKEGEYEKNFNTLKSLIHKTPKDSIIVAPELCLSHYSFNELQTAHDFGSIALIELLKLSKQRVICFTLVEKVGDDFFNSAKILNNGKIVHSQEKVKLFKFGDENRYFQYGNEDNIKIIEIDGLKFALLICFELRFIDLWKKIQGADIIMIPSMWGVLRKEHYESITKTLAIINQAFVIASNSSNKEMASSSGIITPFGVEYRDDSSKYISLQADLKEIKKMRRYMDIGLG